MSNSIMIRKADEGGYILNIQGAYGTKEVVCSTFEQAAKKIFDSISWEKVGDKLEVNIRRKEDKDPPSPAGDDSDPKVSPPQGESVGPDISVRASCVGCKYCVSAYWVNQGDSGYTTQCTAPDFPKPRDIGDSSWDTPNWCPQIDKARFSPDHRTTALTFKVSEIVRRLDTFIENKG